MDKELLLIAMRRCIVLMSSGPDIGIHGYVLYYLDLKYLFTVNNNKYFDSHR